MFAIVFGAATTLHPQELGKLDLEAAELLIAELIGAPVYVGGKQIGVVSDVSLSPHVRVEKISVRMPFPVRPGERIVEIPASSFTVLQGAVALHLTADELNTLPAMPLQRNEGHKEEK